MIAIWCLVPVLSRWLINLFFLNAQFGYKLYRRVLGYYSREEDAYDLRKAMPRDVLQKSVVPLDRPVYPHELEHD